jgi:serine/threonine protein kinase
MTENCGTVQWMAPEVLANHHYAEPADVYSFGKYFLIVFLSSNLAPGWLVKAQGDPHHGLVPHSYNSSLFRQVLFCGSCYLASAPTMV